MAHDEKEPIEQRIIDSDDLPSKGGDAEVPEGMAARPQGTEIEGTGSTGGVGTGTQVDEVSGDLTTGPDPDDEE